MDKLVSIVTPTYNCGKYILETIESVINQTYQTWEMIIIDDYSSDDTYDVVKQMIILDQRIKYHRLPSNCGAAIARSVGIQLAKGKYIAFLDSDDIWHSKKLEIQIKYMELTKSNFTCTTYSSFIDKISSPVKTFKAKKKANYNQVLLSCPIGNSSVIYNQDVLGKFEVPNIRKRNDDALWLQILKKEEFIIGLDINLMFYRVRKGSISSNKFTLIKYHWKLYREIEKLSFIKSIYHIAIWILIKLLGIK